MNPRPAVRSVSIYFFAGDFADVLRRHREGEPQVYGTHDEVARLLLDLSERGMDVTVHSFCTPERKEDRPLERIAIRSLGGRSYKDDSVLEEAVRADSSDALIPHFPNVRLLQAVAAKGRPAAAFLATSFYRRGLRSAFNRRRTIAALNRSEFGLVANHCLPATEHLADLGVDRSKLVAWDVPHPFSPADSTAKTQAPGDPIRLFYAGSISEEKGVGDVVRAIPQLEERERFRFAFAGNGDLDGMRRLARSLGVESSVTFLGSIPNPDVFRRFREADLLLVPSRWEFQEGFPLTMFEAVASRTPIVCSDHPIFSRAIEDGVNGVLFGAGDSRSLARAIGRAAGDPDLYLRLSANAAATWEKLRGPADWRRLIVEWVTQGPGSPWIERHRLDRLLADQVERTEHPVRVD